MYGIFERFSYDFLKKLDYYYRIHVYIRTKCKRLKKVLYAVLHTPGKTLTVLNPLGLLCALNYKQTEITCKKSVRIRSFSGLFFPAFGLNTERYGVSLCIESECGKIRTRKTPNTDTYHAKTCKKVPL